MIKRIATWLRSKREQLEARRLEYLKRIEKEHYLEFLECNEVARDLGRMAATARIAGACITAATYKEQAQEEYEAADFHYAAYIEAREMYRQATNN
jgi:hypothetical protein